MFILKQLRRKKNISQTDLAQAIGVSLRTIQLYEKPEANIPIKNLTKIAQFFDLSIAELYMREVSDFEEPYGLGMVKSSKGQPVKQVGLGKFLISVPLISAEQQKAFTLHFKDDNFLKGLSQIGFVVEEITDRDYLAFEITNDSMDNGRIEGIPNKSIVLGVEIQKDELVHQLKTQPYHPWMLLSGGTLMCKRISTYKPEEGALKCHSLNSSPEYTDFELELRQIDLLFLIIKKQLG